MALEEKDQIMKLKHLWLWRLCGDGKHVNNKESLTAEIL